MKRNGSSVPFAQGQGGISNRALTQPSGGPNRQGLAGGGWARQRGKLPAVVINFIKNRTILGVEIVKKMSKILKILAEKEITASHQVHGN